MVSTHPEDKEVKIHCRNCSKVITLEEAHKAENMDVRNDISLF